MTAEIRKVTISLPAHLLDFADRFAARRKTNRSQVISQALAAVQAAEEERLAAEGYRFYAEEATDFAQAIAPAMAEVVGTISKEAADGATW